MARPFRFGVQCTEFGDSARVLATAKACEQFGYSEFFTADHLGSADPFAPLMVAASATTNLRVGPLVLNNAFHNPVLVARTAATVDHMTGGRLLLGLGTGYAQGEHDAIGVALPRPGERVTQFEESLSVLRLLLDTGRAAIDGEHYQIDVEDLGIRPQQARVPFLVGGHGRRVVSVAARHADIFQFTGLTHGPDGSPNPGGFRLSDLMQRKQWLEDIAGHRIGQIECSALVQRTSVGGNVRSVLDDISATWGLSLDELDDCPFAMCGSVEQIIDKVERMRTLLGISHFVVRDAEGFAPVVDALNGA